MSPRFGARCAALLFAVLANCIATSRAAAQSQPSSPNAGDVVVRVIDAANEPVIAAEVVLHGEKNRTFTTRTDSAGIASFFSVNEGLWVLTLRRLGVKPVTASLRIAPGRNRYTVRTNDEVLRLQGIRVVGEKSYSPRLDDFERRVLAHMPNATVTRAQIERLAPIALSRMLRGMAGLRIGDSSGNIVAISTRGYKPSRKPKEPGFGMVQCVLRVSLDGMLLPALTNIDQIIPDDVHGVEVYFGPARMPPELDGLRTDNWCGLVAIWTRDR